MNADQEILFKELQRLPKWNGFCPCYLGSGFQRYSCLFRKTFRIENIVDIKQIGIKPIQEFGAWGIRGNGEKGALILGGDEGIELHFQHAKPFVVSTKNAGKFLDAVKKNLKSDGRVIQRIELLTARVIIRSYKAKDLEESYQLIGWAGVGNPDWINESGSVEHIISADHGNAGFNLEYVTKNPAAEHMECNGEYLYSLKRESMLFLNWKGSVNMYQIREMNHDDYWKAFELWSSTDGMGLGDSDSEESITQFLKRNGGHSFVCTDDEMIIGTVLCGHDGRRGFLYHVAVSKEYRRNGIGKRLVEHALDSLKKVGILKCHLMVYENNILGNQYWNKLGWIKRNDILVYSREIAGADLRRS